MIPPAALPALPSPFLAGLKRSTRSVFLYVLLGTFVGIGAMAQQFGFSLVWLTLSTMLIWAAPAQVILITALTSGATLFEAAVAVTLSAIRLFFMVVTLLPMLKTERTPLRSLLLPTHLTAISLWMEAGRLLPDVPQEQRIPFTNGISVGYMSAALIAGAIGFMLAAKLPPALAAALLFLTPLSFLISTVRSSTMLMEKIAFVLGLMILPAIVLSGIGLDLLWTGLIGGTAAYAFNRWRGGKPDRSAEEGGLP